VAFIRIIPSLNNKFRRGIRERDFVYRDLDSTLRVRIAQI